MSKKILGEMIVEVVIGVVIGILLTEFIRRTNRIESFNNKYLMNVLRHLLIYTD